MEEKIKPFNGPTVPQRMFEWYCETERISMSKDYPLLIHANSTGEFTFYELAQIIYYLSDDSYKRSMFNSPLKIANALARMRVLGEFTPGTQHDVITIVKIMDRAKEEMMNATK